MRYFLLLFLIFWAFPVQAHRINIFATYQKGYLEGEVFFNDGRPAKNAKIEVVTPRGTFHTRTDQEGRFTLQLPEKIEKGIKIIAYAGMGHRAEMVLTPEPPSGAVPPSKTTIPWRDIFSGLGYIVGVFGFLAYFKARAMTSGKARS